MSFNRNKRNLFFLSLLMSLLLLTLKMPNVAAAGFSLDLEKQIGSNSAASYEKEYKIITLPKEQQKRVERIFNNLVQQTSRKDEIEYNLKIVADDSVNAAAIPGGYIYLNSGTVKYARTDGEIAGVLGHELAHVEKKHSMKAVYKKLGFSLLLILVDSKTQDHKYKDAVNSAAALSLVFVNQGYSQKAEFEADTLGTQLAMRSGYSKEDILNFWERFSEGQAEDGKLEKMLSSHPPAEERIANIRKVEI